MDKLTIEDVPVKGKLVFIRVDFNVPLDENGNIVEDTRIRVALPTINRCIDEGARIVIASHLGRPKGVVNHKFSLAPVRKRLERLLTKEVVLAEDCVGPQVDAQARRQAPARVKCGKREPDPSRGAIGKGQGCGRWEARNDQLRLPVKTS